jgi:hypothetical protein
VRKRFFFSLFMCVSTASQLVGCATTTGPMSSGMPSYDPNKPQVFLPGADVEQAKGVAMGSAVSKGWQVASTSDNVLVLERELNAAAAESVGAGSSLSATPPKVQVRSDFFPRDGGVDVVVSAEVISRDAEKGEQRQDFTESYRADLERSLTSLRQNWAKSGSRVASATPPLPTSQNVPLTPDPDVPLAPISQSAPGAASAASTPMPEPTQEPATGIGSGWPAGSAASATGVVGATGSSQPAPTETRSVSSAPAPTQTVPSVTASPVAAEPVSPADNMMALNQPAATGVWAYYAEHYARVRGCTLAGEGAVLVEKQPDYEMHRVYCEGGQTFLVRCNAGVCRGMK